MANEPIAARNNGAERRSEGDADERPDGDVEDDEQTEDGQAARQGVGRGCDERDGEDTVGGIGGAHHEAPRRTGGMTASESPAA
ncbi:MAG: hypothetical protein AAF772_10730 [Acidobacteriota bacterium]